MEIVDLLHLAAGAALALLAWLTPRRVASARLRRLPALLLDIAPIAIGVGLLGLATGRPVFAGVVVLALAAGFSLADYTMRQTLREPAVFSEAVELPQVVTHPHLYLPFAGPGLVLGGAATATLLALALLIIEPPLWPPYPGTALAVAALLTAIGCAFAYQPLLQVVGNVLRRVFRPTGEPFADAAALGPFGMLIVHAVIARAERGARQRALGLRDHAGDGAKGETRQPSHSGAARSGEPGIHAYRPVFLDSRLCPPGSPGMTHEGAGLARGGPIIVVQCESFFDVRRLSAQMPQKLLAGFDHACVTASRFGRLGVPAWGANTMRAEFAVLTGVSESALGYDRFNPYYALARVPLDSHVWRLRRAGYRTICLHPFDRRFFRRDLAMPALGFEQFLGRETLGGSRRPPYYSDLLLATDILRVIDQQGPEVFVFAITMGNHGPWLAQGPPVDPVVAKLFDPTDIPGGDGLLRYLDGLKRSDEMLQVLMSGLERREMPATLAFYGDHLPSLSRVFAHYGFSEASSDYLIWHGGSGATAQRSNLAAHELGAFVIDSAPRGADAPAAARSACLPPPEPARFA